ncbi:Uncharacterised protein [Chryseobacterium carnipullorum]|uniref:Uncharacterized protein n=1 Tax=Chryseobacterium carnipullorum TaxID=1124835 RepID=A0A376DWL1_CHRCU|nr:Uncharacterised protein [Chryseobacterium carnipullorum]
MKKTLAVFVLSVQILSAQNMAQKLDKATKDLMDSSGLFHQVYHFMLPMKTGHLFTNIRETKAFRQPLRRRFSRLEQRLKLWEKIILLKQQPAIPEICLQEF